MIDEPRDCSDQESVSCRECQREIPPSEATSVEAEEYVCYFCGLDCYEAWRRRAEREADGKA